MSRVCTKNAQMLDARRGWSRGPACGDATRRGMWGALCGRLASPPLPDPLRGPSGNATRRPRDEGRIGHTKPRSATPQMGIFRANPEGRGFPGGLLCRAACEGGLPFAARRFAHAAPERDPSARGQRRRTRLAQMLVALLTARFTAHVPRHNVARAILESCAAAMWDLIRGSLV
jgi:hypothetical protein